MGITVFVESMNVISFLSSRMLKNLAVTQVSIYSETSE